MATAITATAIGAVVAYRWGGKVTSATIRRSLLEILPAILGCEVDIGFVGISVTGKVTIKDLFIRNPVVEGVEFVSEQLFKIGEITADLSLHHMLSTSIQEIIINEVTVKGLCASYESFTSGWFGLGGNSNLLVVFKHVASLLPHRKKPNKPVEPTPPPPPAPVPEPVDPEHPVQRRKFIIKKIDIEDIQLDIIGTVARSLGTTGQHVCLGSLCFEDFSESTKIEDARAVLHFFSSSLSASMLYAVTGKKEYHFGDFSRTFGHYTESAVHHLIGQ